MLFLTLQDLPELIAEEPLIPLGFSLLGALVVWLAIYWAAARAWRNWRRLPLPPRLGPAGAGGVCAIIPARNEAATIARAVRALMAAGVEVVVVDDHSSDATAEQAAAAGARVVAAPVLPPRWLGRPFACWNGAQATQARWLLFSAADAELAPHLPATLLAVAQRDGLVAAAVLLDESCQGRLGRFLLPYARLLWHAGLDPDALNDPKRLEATAAGACLLVRRDAYEFLQGHRAVASSAVDDLDLARLFKRHRMSIRVFRGAGMGTVAAGGSRVDVTRQLERHLRRFRQARPAARAIAVAAAASFLAWFPALGWLLAERLWVAAAVFSLAPALTLRRWYGGLRHAWAAPLAMAIVPYVGLKALVKRSLDLPTGWKGRQV